MMLSNVLERRAHLLQYAAATQAFESTAPYWAPKVSTVGDHTTAPRYTGAIPATCTGPG